MVNPEKSGSLKVVAEKSGKTLGVGENVFLLLRFPFPQIDVIGAMVIVWRVRGKIIRSVLCNIVHSNCAQCNAYTYERTYSSLEWVLSHWALFTVLR